MGRRSVGAALSRAPQEAHTDGPWSGQAPPSVAPWPWPWPAPCERRLAPRMLVLSSPWVPLSRAFPPSSPCPPGTVSITAGTGQHTHCLKTTHAHLTALGSRMVLPGCTQPQQGRLPPGLGGTCSLAFPASGATFLLAHGPSLHVQHHRSSASTTTGPALLPRNGVHHSDRLQHLCQVVSTAQRICWEMGVQVSLTNLGIIPQSVVFVLFFIKERLILQMRTDICGHSTCLISTTP